MPGNTLYSVLVQTVIGLVKLMTHALGQYLPIASAISS